MFSNLNSILGLKTSSTGNSDIGISGNVGNNHFILCKDTLKADGSWLLHHFLTSYLQSDQNAVLIGLDQTFFHYTSIQKKLGINLINETSRNRFKFIDCFSNPTGWSFLKPKDDKTIPFSFSNFSEIEKKNPLLKLFLEIKKTVESFEKTERGGCCILIDNINLLLSYTENISQLLEFIQYCQSLIHQHSPSSSLIALCHSSSDPLFFKSISHKSELIFFCEELETGISKEIDGKVTILFNGNITKDQEKLKKQFLYKVGENYVKLFTINQI